MAAMPARSIPARALFRVRPDPPACKVEIEWLKALAAEPHFAEIAAFSPATVAELDALVANFGPSRRAEVKAIEATTNHDVKALEYWIKKRLGQTPR
jgi:adenylosuccinate lyase